MLTKNELRYTLALQRVPNLGDAMAKRLILKVGSAEGIFKEKGKICKWEILHSCKSL